MLSLATDGKAYFKQVNFLIPQSWQTAQWSSPSLKTLPFKKTHTMNVNDGHFIVKNPGKATHTYSPEWQVVLYHLLLVFSRRWCSCCTSFISLCYVLYVLLLKLWLLLLLLLLPIACPLNGHNWAILNRESMKSTWFFFTSQQLISSGELILSFLPLSVPTRCCLFLTCKVSLMAWATNRLYNESLPSR